MDTNLTLPARLELARAIRSRYQAATGDDKKQILAEFIAVGGYHPKHALRVLNGADPEPPDQRTRRRARLYDAAAGQALIVLWEASDRVCSKRLKPLLRILLPALERHGHLHLEEAIREKVLAMSAATIDRILRVPRAATIGKKLRRAVPEIRRRIAVRTFADWNDPPPGSMEMDLVAHCGDTNRGSFVHSLVLTDIASGWTECTPLVVRESTLLVEALERVRQSLPFALRALDVDNGAEFINETLIRYCTGHGIEFTRSRPYRKNDQAWIEQKNGSVVRRMTGYRRFEGIAGAQALARLYATSRFFVNFFQPSFKLAEKTREGAHVSKQYHTPQTPSERLLGHPATPDEMKAKLQAVATALDPLQLLEEIRATQSHLVVLAEGVPLPVPSSDEQNLAGFLAGLSSAWRAGEIRPTHARETSPPRYLRRIQIAANESPATAAVAGSQPLPPSLSAPAVVESQPTCPPAAPQSQATAEMVGQPIRSGTRGRSRRFAFTQVWPELSRRLEARPNLSAVELFDQLRAEYPGRYDPGQCRSLARRVKAWRELAQGRGLIIGPRKNRSSGRSRGPRTYRTRADEFKADWAEICEHLEADPDQTGRELLAHIQSRYPGRYRPGQLRTLQSRLKTWRAQAARRLVFGIQHHPLGDQIRQPQPGTSDDPRGGEEGG